MKEAQNVKVLKLVDSFDQFVDLFINDKNKYVPVNKIK